MVELWVDLHDVEVVTKYKSQAVEVSMTIGDNMPYFLQGMHITVRIERPTQLADDVVGGSQTSRTTVMSGVTARFGTPRTPTMLRAQGIEVTDMYDLVLQSYNNVYDVQINDYIIPEKGQFVGMDFVVKAVQNDTIGDNPNDRRNHKYLSLQRVDRSRNLQ